MVLINWYGRPDFVDHVYVKANERDVDTGAPLGLNPTFFTRAWGGTAHDDPEDRRPGAPVSRVYFHDLSAGPTFLADWDLVAPRSRTNDFPAGTLPQYRLPPIWEYRNAGYRPFDDLTADLADKVVNDLFVGSLAFANPFYPTDLVVPALPSELELDTNLFAWNPAADPRAMWTPSVAKANLDKLGYEFSIESHLHETSSARLREAFARTSAHRASRSWAEHELPVIDERDAGVRHRDITKPAPDEEHGHTRRRSA